MNQRTVFPIELFAKIATYDLFVMSNLTQCCHKFMTLDAGKEIVERRQITHSDYLGYLHYKSDNYRFEYIHYGSWRIWMIFDDPTNVRRIHIRSHLYGINETHILPPNDKVWGGNTGLKDIDGVLRWDCQISSGRFVYMFYGSRFSLRVIFCTNFELTPINVVCTWVDHKSDDWHKYHIYDSD